MSLFKFAAVVQSIESVVTQKGETKSRAVLLVTDGKSAVVAKIWSPSDLITARVGQGISGLAMLVPSSNPKYRPDLQVLSAEAAVVVLPAVGQVQDLIGALGGAHYADAE